MLPTIRSGFGQEEGDLHHHLDRKAQGEGSRPSSGKGQSRQSLDRKERQGGSQSSSSSSGAGTKHHHKAPSSRSTPSSTITSGALEAAQAPKDQGKRQGDPRDWSRDGQVQFVLFILLTKSFCVLVFLVRRKFGFLFY